MFSARSFASLIFPAFIIFSGSSGQAMMAQSAADQHWKNVDEVDAYLQTPVCRTFTQASDSKELVELSLSFAKDGKLLPMIRLETRLAASRVDVKLSRSVTETLFLLKRAADSNDNNIYWYAPVNFSRFENFLRDNDVLQLILDPKGQPLPIKISLSGSTNALKQVATCLKTTKEPTEFLKLLNQQKDNLTPDLGDRTPAFLYQATQAAYAAYLAGQGTAAALAQLQKPFANLLASEASGKKAVAADQLALTKAQEALDKLNQEISSLTDKIAKDQTDLAKFKQDKPAADADLKQKKATYQTLLPQLTPYSKAIADAVSLVKKIQASILSDQNLIVKNGKKIVSDRQETIDLTNSLPSLRSRVNRTADAANRAASAYNSFNVSSEISSRLRSDGMYQMALSSLESDQRNLQNAQSKQQSAQSKVWQAQSALSSCQGNPQTSANCSSQQSALSSAQSEESSASMEESSARMRVSSDQDEVDRRKNSVTNDVQRQADDLRSAYNSAQSAYDNARAEYADAQQRIRDIPGEIVRLQAAIDKATAEIPVLQDQLVAAQNQQAAAQASYDQFAKQIGFDVATSQFQAAQQLDDSINKGIADLTKSIPLSQKQLKKDQSNLPQVQKTAVQAQTTLTAAQAKLTPIQTQLAPYYEQAAPLMAAQKQQALDLQTQRAIYQDLYKFLMAN